MNQFVLFGAVPLNSNDLAGTIMGAIFFIGFFAIIVVKMLIKHQQHMAALMRQEVGQYANDSSALREEVKNLSSLIQQQTILLDDLQGRTISGTPPSFHVRTGS
ncbi:MAG TPA: hypothetical protein VGL56_11810 [Fimbriimonadaceae bacterium]|jgi:hypothetical protein